jgi:hypothetical protein
MITERLQKSRKFIESECAKVVSSMSPASSAGGGGAGFFCRGSSRCAGGTDTDTVHRLPAHLRSGRVELDLVPWPVVAIVTADFSNAVPVG